MFAFFYHATDLLGPLTCKCYLLSHCCGVREADECSDRNTKITQDFETTYLTGRSESILSRTHDSHRSQSRCCRNCGMPRRSTSLCLAQRLCGRPAPARIDLRYCQCPRVFFRGVGWSQPFWKPCQAENAKFTHNNLGLERRLGRFYIRP